MQQCYRFNICLSLVGLLLLGGCFYRQQRFSPFDLKQAQRVTVVSELPKSGLNCDFFGSLKGEDGYGEGDLGLKGLRDNALLHLKIRAAQLQANYLILTKESQPYYNYGLNQTFENRYIIEGNAYFCR